MASPKRSALLLSVLLAAGLGISACGGGGGGGTSSGNTPPPPGGTTPPDTTPPTGTTPPVTGAAPTVPVSTLSSIRLSGTVLAGLSGTGLTAASVGADASGLEEVRVTARLYRADGSLLDTLHGTTDANGAFNLPLSEDKLAELAWVELQYEKDGYVVGRKRIDYSAGDSSLMVNTRLGPEVVVTQSRGDLAVTANGTRAFTFGLVRTSAGELAAVAGSAGAARAAAGGTSLLEVEVPVTSVPDSVSAVTARMAHFDPSDQQQVQSFPGNFIGSGCTGGGTGIDLNAQGSACAAAGEEYRLISSVFAQVRLEDQDGNALPVTTATGAAIAAGTTPVMRLSVPSGSYATITSDMDGVAAGVQVPIYIYSGGWKYAGNGTLVQWNGSAYADYAGAVDPIPGIVTDLYVEIAVTEGNEWIQWVNLDWPIKAGETSITSYCFDGTIAYAGGTAEPYKGYLDVQLPDGGYDWKYIADGKLSFSNEVLGSGNSFTFYIWNQRIFDYESVTPDLTTATKNAAGCYELGQWTLTNPRQYSLAGRLTRGGTPVGGREVYVWGENYWDWAITNSQGEFSLSVPAKPLTVEVTGSTIALAVEVNGTKGGGEASDDGTTATVEIAIPNLKPVIAGIYAPERTKFQNSSGTGSAEFVATVYDMDSDKLTLTWSCAAASGTSGSCAFKDLATAASAFAVNGKRFEATGPGSYTWTLTASDDNGGTSSRSGAITVDAANRPPRVLSVAKQPDNTLLGCKRNTTTGVLECTDTLIEGATAGVSYAVNAYDPDGDSFSCGGGCTLTAPAADQALSITVTDVPASGSPLTDKVSINVTVKPDQAPVITYAAGFPLRQSLLVDEPSQSVDLFADARDDNSAVTYSWSADDPAVTITNATSTRASIAAGAWTITAQQPGPLVTTITLVVEAGGKTAQTSFKVEISHRNTPPQLQSVTASSTIIQPGQPITLAAVAGDDLGTGALSYSWAVGGNTYTGANPTVPGSAHQTPGSYTAVVTVTDGDGASATGQVSYRVNALPVVSAPAADAVINVREGQIGSVTAVATDDVGGLSYSWDFNGAISSGITLAIPDTLPQGNYPAELTVTDADGASTVVAFTVTVDRNNLPPEIFYPVGAETIVLQQGGAMSVTAEVDDDFKPLDLTYAWTIGGVSFNTATIDLQGSVNAGTHAGSLTVTDADGAGTSVSFTVQVLPPNQPPVVSAPTEGQVFNVQQGSSLNIAASATDDGAGPLTYEWLFDNALSSGASLVVPDTQAAGSYPVTLSVFDADGASTTVNFTVNVNRLNQAPVIASPTAASTWRFGATQAVSVTASASDDLDTTLGYEWSVGGVTYQGATLNIAAGVLPVGVHAASLVVTDSEGGTSQVNFSIEVTAGNVSVIIN